MDAAVWTAIGLEQRFARVDGRFDALEARLDGVNARLDAHLDRHAS